MNFVMRRVENILWKGENASYQHFLIFPQCFQKAFLSGSLTLSQTTNFRLFQTESILPTKISNLMKMAEIYPNR